MSAKSFKRIKEIRQKTGESFSSPIPLGTNGFLVDMLSKLDLEQELKLGNNHYVNIDQGEDSLIITEYYMSQPREDRSIEEMVTTGKITYKVVTKFLEEQYEEDYLLVNKKEDNNFFALENDGSGCLIIQSDKKSKNSLTKIEMSLYDADHLSEGASPLHTKIITIQSIQGEDKYIDYIIDQQIGNIPKSSSSKIGQATIGSATIGE